MTTNISASAHARIIATQDRINISEKAKLKADIRKCLMNSKLKDSQTGETIPQLVFNEGMDLIVEEVAKFIELRETKDWEMVA